MKIRRVLIYEGPEERVMGTVERSWCHDGTFMKGQSRVQKPGGGLTITELTCIDITDEKEPEPEVPRGQQPMDGEI